jgi:putative MATE family efflux protein
LAAELRRIARLAIPVVLAQLSQTFMGLADTLMVGRLGPAAVAAVGIATLLFAVLANALKAVETGVQALIARRVGEGRDGEVGQILGSAMVVLLGGGAAACVLGLLWPRFWMSLVSQDPVVRELGSSYLAWRCVFLLPFLLYFHVRACFDGIGWTRIGMATGIGMNLVNVGLNWVLIFGKLGAPAMGVKGAAVASGIASLLASLAIGAVALQRPIRRRFRLFARDIVRWDQVCSLLRVGWPPMLQAAGLLAGLVAFYVILGRLGTVSVAAGNIVMRIASVSIMPVIGIGVAVQTVVGQSLGARDERQAVRAGWSGVVLAATFMSFVGLVFLLWPEFLLGAFVTDPAVIAAGRPILHLTALVQVIASVGLVLGAAQRGAGATRTVMLVDLGTAAAILLPGGWIGAILLGRGLVGAWYAFLVWFLVHASLMAWHFHRGAWLRVRI